MMLTTFNACSLQKMAMGSVADALSGTGTAFSSDDDPEFVADAVPFALKTMEALMPQLPEHAELRESACSGFVQYAYAFVVQPAALRGELAGERAAAVRAKKMFRRASRYCEQAIEIRHPGFASALHDSKTVLTADSQVFAALTAADVPAMYWLAASMALQVTANKEEVDALSLLPLVDALLRRALALDADWDHGTLHEFVIAFDGGRSETQGGSVARARAALAKALSLSGGKRIGPYVSFAENVCVAEQNRSEFDKLLGLALAFDIDSSPENKLANTLARRRAQKLVETADELILPSAE